MTDATSATGITSAAAPSAPLDDVMLAMDIVDTLRHDRSLALDALDDAERERALIEQVRRTYAQQGIAVSDALIADAVRSLRERRFVYTPPKRSLAVWLARLYVSRARWAPRLALALVVLGALAGGAWWLGDRIERWRFAEVEQQVAQVESGWATLRQRTQALQLRIEGIDDAPQAVRIELDALSARIGAAASTAVDAIPDADALRARWETAREQLDATIATQQTALGEVGRELDAAERRVDAVIDLLAQRRRVDDLVATIRSSPNLPPRAVERAQRLAAQFRDGLASQGSTAGIAAVPATLAALAQQAARRDAVALSDIAPAHRDAAAAHVAAMDAALSADDDAGFERAASAYEDLERTLAAAYTLRIVNRPGERSGVWRHPEGNRDARNYYIVVDAVGPDGARMPVPVRNEETGRTETVGTFAVRVPESVYEAVRDDKQDNGLIDRDRFGEKRRGELEPRYEFDVAGGMITRW